MKTVLITGSSSGIGKACVDLFAQKGWNVAATMRHPVADSRDNVLVLPLDVTDKKSIHAAVKKAEERFSAIDVLVNNAGYGQIGAMESMSDKQMRDIFETNVFGVMNVTNEILPHMRERNEGVIINMSSMIGLISTPLSGYNCATKHALESISESLWHELSITKVRIKVIEPSFTKTNFQTKGMVRGEIKVPLYEEYIENKWNNVQKYHNADSPEQVAEVVYQAAIDETPKLRYTCGKRAQKELFYWKIMPDSMFLRYINKRFKR